MPNAMRGDLPELPDGIYQISIDGLFLNFMVYTVNTGTLEGQRILKRPSAEGWKGFATLQVADPEHPAGDTAYAGVHLWQSQRRTVSVGWVNQVAMAVRSFIQRVQDVPEDHFIVIQDCPEIPDHIRSRLNPPEVDPLESLIEEGARARQARFVERRITTRQPRRITSLAMSAFDPTVVR